MRIDPTPLPTSQPAPGPVRAVAGAFAIPPLLQLAEPLQAGDLAPTAMPVLRPTPAQAPPSQIPTPGPTPNATLPTPSPAWRALAPQPDRLSLSLPASLPTAAAPEPQLQAILQRLAGDLPLSPGLQLALRPASSPYLPPTAGTAMPDAALSPVALLQGALTLEIAPGHSLPARMTLALMPAMLAMQPEFAEALKLRLAADLPMSLKLDAPAAELAGQRLLFELVDPRAQWAMQALAMRGLLVVGQPGKLRARTTWAPPTDEDETADAPDAKANAAYLSYTLPDDDGPPRISTLRWAGLLLYPLLEKLRALWRGY